MQRTFQFGKRTKQNQQTDKQLLKRQSLAHPPSCLEKVYRLDKKGFLKISA